MNASRNLLSHCTLKPEAAPGSIAVDDHSMIEQARISIHDWNADVATAHNELAQQVENSCQQLLPAGVSRDSLSDETARLVDRYSTADSLALHLQSRLRNLSKTVILFALCGIIGFELSHWLGQQDGHVYHFLAKVALTCFVAAWCIAIFLARRSHHVRLQERCQDYRALAEGLRVQFYWHWAGLKNNAFQAYPKRQRDELLWIRFALEQWAPATESSSSDAKTVLSAWIEDQSEYFVGKDGRSGAIQENGQLNALFRNRGRLFLLTGVTLGGVAAAVVWFGKLLFQEHVVHQMEGFITTAAGLSLVGAAACYAWKERFAYAENFRNYSSMARIYEEARARLEEKTLSSEAILLELGEEAIAESTEWRLLHRERHATEARL